MILTIIASIIILSALVLIHELGHFLTAKKAGVKIEEFAIGFPPKIWSKKIGETDYSINAIPIGGYVRMEGELEEHPSPRAFENQSRFKRFIISISGVVMNLLLAWVILAIGFAVGMAPIVSPAKALPGEILSSKIMIAQVNEDSPAKELGLSAGDIVISATSDGEKFEINNLNDLSKFTKSHKGKLAEFEYEHNKETIVNSVTISEDDEAPLGVISVEQGVVRVPWYRAPDVALRETVKIFELTAVFFQSFIAKLFSTGEVQEGIGGPVAIYAYTGTMVKAGLMAVLQFVAILSVNFALINILPFPALDGGRIIFILSEMIAGRKLIKQKVEHIIHLAGFAILILLIIAVTYNDIVRLIKS